MTILSELSADVLGEIIDSSKSFYIFLRLWLCGSKTLNSKLAQGVTRIRLVGKFPTPCFVLSKFPRSVLSLHNLRRLTVKSYYSLVESSLVWSDIIKSLPPTLERLHLSFPGSRLALLDYNVSYTSGAPSNSSITSSTLIDLHTLFPNLHTMHVVNDGKGMQIPPALRLYGQPDIPSELLSSLPPTLTRLGLGWYQKYERPLLSILPRNITRLDSRFELDNIDSSHLQQDWSLAPPNLQHVTRITIRAVDVQWLPRTLTKCQLIEAGSSVGQEPTLDFVRGLPSKLTTLRLWFHHSPVEGLLESLPSSLLELVAVVDSTYTPWRGISVQQLRILPATLRSLEIIIDDSLADIESDEDIWPPNLQTLHLTLLNPDTSSKVFARLPHKTINELTLNFDGEGWHGPQGIVLEAPLLPQGLTSLTLKGYGISSIKSPLPPLLHTLDTTSLTGLTAPIESYPVYLKHLKLKTEDSKGLLSLTVIPVLPSGLITLQLTMWRYEWLPFVPKTLTSLEIERLYDQTKQSKNLWADLPVGLKTLSVGETIKASSIDAFDFSSLVNLETLKLYGHYTGKAAVNASKVFPTLPRGLIVLALGCTFSAQDAIHLPRLLRLCECMHWTDDLSLIAPNFPLFALKFSNGVVDEAMLRARYQSFL